MRKMLAFNIAGFADNLNPQRNATSVKYVYQCITQANHRVKQTYR
jgi:hypothetical protein